jgi:murein endopeptidase
MRLALALTLVATVLLAAALSGASRGASTEPQDPAIGVPLLVPLTDLPPPPPQPRIRWRESKAIGLPYAGRLERGVQLPSEGKTYFTWDPIRETKPNRGWRRWGTDRLIRTMLRVARRYRRENPGAPRLAIGDLSRPRGGDFGPQFGELGHASHQNGLDIDIYYPRRDRRETAPKRPSQVDGRLSQRLVDMFVAAGAQKVFVGPSLDLGGPRRVVSPLVHHDNHLHVRLPGAPR